MSLAPQIGKEQTTTDIESDGEDKSIIKSIGKSCIRQIVAGQAITDLSSAVKELIDNSIDAGAKSIIIRLANNGVNSIEVCDDGSGILLQSRQHIGTKHATSKIVKFEDLYDSSSTNKTQLQSLGFRGEAIFCLCNISKEVSVLTKTKDDRAGEKLLFDRNGKLIKQDKIALRTGTTVTISDLFHYLPVRRADFIKRIKNQRARMIKLVQAYSVLYWNIKFTLIDITKKKSKSSSTSVATKAETRLASSSNSKSLRDSILSVLGSDFFNDLCSVTIDLSEIVNSFEKSEKENSNTEKENCETAKWNIQGYISKPPISAASSSIKYPYKKKKTTNPTARELQFLAINSRPVEMPKISRVLSETWKQFNNTNNNKRPACILTLTLPNSMIDINLNPNKREVLLTKESEILTALQDKCYETWMSFGGTFGLNQVENESNNEKDQIRDSSRNLAEISQEMSKTKHSQLSHPRRRTKFPETPEKTSVVNIEMVEDEEAKEEKDDYTDAVAAAAAAVITPQTQHSEITHPQRKRRADVVGAGGLDCGITSQDNAEDDIGYNRKQKQSRTPTMKQMSLPFTAMQPSSQRTRRFLSLSEEKEPKPTSSSKRSSYSSSNLSVGFGDRRRWDQVRASFHTGRSPHSKKDSQEDDSEILCPSPLAEDIQKAEELSRESRQRFSFDVDNSHSSSKRKRDADGNDEDDDDVGSPQPPKKLSFSEQLKLRKASRSKRGSMTREIQTSSATSRRSVRSEWDRELMPNKSLKRYSNPVENEESENSSFRETTGKSDYSNTSLSKRRKSTESRKDYTAGDTQNSPISVETKPQSPPQNTAVWESFSSTSNVVRQARTAWQKHKSIRHELKYNKPSKSQKKEDSQSVMLAGASQVEPRNTSQLKNSDEDSLGEPSSPSSPSSQRRVTFNKTNFSQMRVIGQFNLGFILAMCPNNHLWIFDQHASDEKYNFEKQCRETVLHEQTLLRPLPLELSACEENCISDNMEVFKRHGFRFQYYENNPPRHRYALKAIPHSGSGGDGRKHVQFGKEDVVTLCSLLGAEGGVTGSSGGGAGFGIGSDGSGSYLNHAVRRYATSSSTLSQYSTSSISGKNSTDNSQSAKKEEGMNILLPKAIAMFASRSCRQSIMIGDTLSKKEMANVIQKLGKVDQPWDCPHGRPTMRHVKDLKDTLLKNEVEFATHTANPCLIVLSQQQEESD